MNIRIWEGKWLVQREKNFCSFWRNHIYARHSSPTFRKTLTRNTMSWIGSVGFSSYLAEIKMFCKYRGGKDLLIWIGNWSLTAEMCINMRVLHQTNALWIGQWSNFKLNCRSYCGFALLIMLQIVPKSRLRLKFRERLSCYFHKSLIGHVSESLPLLWNSCLWVINKTVWFNNADAASLTEHPHSALCLKTIKLWKERKLGKSSVICELRRTEIKSIGAWTQHSPGERLCWNKCG